jgi:hypothetical protein
VVEEDLAMTTEQQPTTDVEGDGSEISYAHQEGLALIAQAQAIQVVDQQSYEDGASFARVIKAHIQRIRDFMRPIKQTAKAAHDSTVQQEKLLLEGPEAAYAEIDRQMTAYDTQQRERRRQAEAEAAKAAAAANGTGMAPVVIPVQVEIPKAEGIAHRSTWRALVTDKDQLIQACCPKCGGSKRISADALEPSMPVLNEWARARKGALQIPGVKAEEVRTMQTRAGG